jgi:dihydrolipoamide dehydrogenase
MSTSSESIKLAVIGGGPGGYAAAFYAADLGMDVTLINPEPNPGGVCLYRGCIPSKALLHAAKVISEAEAASKFGVAFSPPKINLEKLRGWKDDVVQKLTGGLGQLGKRRKVRYLNATAVFKDGHTLEVTPVENGPKETVRFDNAIIATGSLPAKIGGLWIDSPRMWDSTTALEITDIPNSLLVIGGGYIGLEMGTVYAALGSKVTVVEMMDSILPGVDKDLSRILAKQLERSFDAVLLNTKVAEIKEQKNGLKVRFEGDNLESGGGVFDRVLMAVGRKPNAGSLNLERTNVETDDQGFVKVDRQRRTTDNRIFAIGDVAGEPMLAHKASHEGRLAVNVIAGRNVVFEPRAVPAVVFTDPEIAWCGLTADEVRAGGITVETVRFPWAASGRAGTLGRSDGVTKLIIDPETDRLLGVGIAGPGAGELIAEGVLAVEMGATAEDIGLSIHPHPTLSETFMEAADLYYGHSSHFYRPKKK